MAKKKIDNIIMGTVKNIWKTATPEQKQDLMRQYSEVRKNGNAEYAKKVAEKLEAIRIYEQSVGNKTSTKSKKVSYKINDKDVFSYTPGEKFDLTSDYDIDDFYKVKSQKIGDIIDGWIKNTFDDYANLIKVFEKEKMKETILKKNEQKFPILEEVN